MNIDNLFEVFVELEELIKTPQFFEQIKAISDKKQISSENKQICQEVKNFISSKQNITSLIPTQLSLQKVDKLYIDGVFDLMHSGHYNAIRQAKSLTHYLIVGVVSDEECLYHKGSLIMNHEQRTTLVRGCKWVDEVLENAPYVPTIGLLDQINCKYIGHGDDFCPDANGQDVYHEFRQQNRLITFKRTDGISTTDIVNKLLGILQEQEKMKQNDEEQLYNLNDQLQSHNSNILQQSNFFNTSRRIRLFTENLRRPKPNDKVVYIDGSFDILHYGHVKVLQQAKEQGDYLIVGVYDDLLAKSLRGKNYPILNLQERVLNVLASKYVDEVILGAPLVINKSMINQFNISVVIQGSLTNTRRVQVVEQNMKIDAYRVPKQLGKYQIIKSKNYQLQDILEKIQENQENYQKVQEKKLQKQEKYYQNQDTTIQEI